MKWAFWRRSKSKPRVSGAGRADSGSGVRSDEFAAEQAGNRATQAAQMRARTRRRLVGASVLLLGTAVVVPMLLDPAPRPLPDSIPIDIPSERTAFVPRLSLPQDSAVTGTAAPARGATEQGDEPPVPAAQDVAPAAATGAAPAKSEETAAGSASAKAETGRWFVQAAALSSQVAAHQLTERLSKAGLNSFVERTETADGALYRVRMGPYASKDGASRARKHLHGLGVDSTVVREQAER